MKKICFVVPTLDRGGAERVALYLMNNINREEFDINLIILTHGGKFFKDLKSDIKVYELNKNRSRYAIFSLYKMLYIMQPDICLVFSAEIATILGLFIAPLLQKIKFVVRELNIQSVCIQSSIRKFLLKLAYKNIDIIISQSRDMTNDLVNYMNIDEQKIIEINNPVDYHYIEKMLNEDVKTPFKNEYKVLLCVGRLSYQKGFDLIINFMGKIKTEKIKLYILGKGEEKEKLENLIESLDLRKNVFLLGEKSNPYIFMKNADAFILSSRFEGFPNVLLEAGVCGLYSICNNSPGGINEIILENVNGNIVDFNNTEQLRDTIIKSLDVIHDKNKIKQSIIERYGIERIVKKYEEILQNLS